MLGLWGCPIYREIQPDPWESFIYEVVWPFVNFNQYTGVGLLVLATVGALIVGIFGSLSARERRVCAALPLIVGAGTFFLVLAASRDARWWMFQSEAQTTLLACAFCVGMLGLLVFERRVFIRDEL